MNAYIAKMLPDCCTQANEGDPEMMLLASQMLASGYGCKADAGKSKMLRDKAAQQLKDHAGESNTTHTT